MKIMLNHYERENLSIPSVALKIAGINDEKLMAASGMVLGFTGGIFAVMLALSAELIFYLLYCGFQKIKGRESMRTLPLAPFLTVGVLAVYFIF